MWHYRTKSLDKLKGQILCISPNGLQAGNCDPPPPPFWMTENHFRSHFSTFQINRQFIFYFSQNGRRQPFWMTENHFWPLCFFFTKWLPGAILDDRKSLSIAFLAISDQYATLIFSKPFFNNNSHTNLTLDTDKSVWRNTQMMAGCTTWPYPS